MTTLLILLFSLSLIYMAIAERFKTFTMLIAIQGLLLFGISYFELVSFSTINLIFIFSETIIFKTIIVPILLYRIIRGEEHNRIHSHSLPGFYSVIIISLLLIFSFLIAQYFSQPIIDKVYFTVSLFALFTGMFMIISRDKIFSHLLGFLVIENAVFLFSLAIGNEMPVLINTGILLDIFISVLILGTFVGKIRRTMRNLGTTELSELKD
jgi:hydrogenase-4 component E